MEDYSRSDVGFYPNKILKEYKSESKFVTEAKKSFNRPIYQTRGTENEKTKQTSRDQNKGNR